MKRTILTLQITAMSLRGLSRFIRLWPLLLLVWWYFAENSPHVLMDCTSRHYLGIGGFQTPKHIIGCPMVILLNPQTGEAL